MLEGLKKSFTQIPECWLQNFVATFAISLVLNSYHIKSIYSFHIHVNHLFMPLYLIVLHYEQDKILLYFGSLRSFCSCQDLTCGLAGVRLSSKLSPTYSFRFSVGSRYTLAFFRQGPLYRICHSLLLTNYYFIVDSYNRLSN